MKFSEFLKEAVKFANANDDDYFYDKYAIVVFNRDDIKRYKFEGRTHGLWSHACKHLSEIDAGFVDNIIAQVKNTIVQYIKDENYPKDFDFKFFKTPNQEVKDEDPLKLINKAPRDSIINFLDLVNDKFMLKEPLAPIEQKMVKFLKALGEQYSKAIIKYMESAVLLDGLKTPDDVRQAIKVNPTIAFYVRQNGREMKIYLNFAERFLIIKQYDGVHTAFQISNCPNDRKSVIRTFLTRFGKKMNFIKPNVYRVFQEIAFDR